MKNMQIGFSYHPSFLGRAIAFFIGKKISHTYFWTDVNGAGMISGADANGLVMQTERRFKVDGSQVVALYSSRDLGFDLDQGIGYLLEHLDEGYNYAGFFGMIPVKVAGWFGKKISNPWGTAGTAFCSQAVADMLVAIRFPGAEALDPASTDPKTLRDFLEARTRKVTQTLAMAVFAPEVR